MIEIAIAAIVLPAFVFALVWLVWRPSWMGFGGRTFWDWINLLAVPLVVGFATFLISAVQSEVALDRSKEEALQRYFARIGNIALSAEYREHPEILAAVGRAETMAVLRLLEGERVGRAFAFLSEMQLLEEFAVEFEGLDMRAAELKNLNLRNLDFEGSDMRGVDLEGSDLRRVDFEETDLRGADLKEVDARGADFDGAFLARVSFDEADLRGANFSGASGLTQGQLDPACYDEKTVLPAGFAAITGRSDGCLARD